MPRTMYTAVGGNAAIPRVGPFGSALYSPDSYSTAGVVPLGLKLDRSEWGRHAYALRHHIFAADVVKRIERAQGEDFHALAEKAIAEHATDKEFNFPETAVRLENPQFGSDTIALRAAICGFANRHHNDPEAVHSLFSQLSRIRSAIPAPQRKELFALAIYNAFKSEAVYHREVMDVLEIHACGGGNRAKAIFALASEKSSVRDGDGVGQDTTSLGASVLQGWSDSVQFTDRERLYVLQQLEARREEQLTFNESPLTDKLITIMIEEPQQFASFPVAYFFQASSDIKTFEHNISLLANCDHPRLNEAIDSLFAIVSHNDDEPGFALLCEIARGNGHAWSLLDGMEVDRILARIQRNPALVGLLADIWVSYRVSDWPAGSVAAPLARLDELNMPDDEGILYAWAEAGSQRAEEILIQIGQKAGTDDVDVEEGTLLSLLDFLKAPDHE